MLEEDYIRLVSDKTKFIAFIDLHRQKADKITQGIARAQAVSVENGKACSDLLTADAKLLTLRNELSNTEAAVAAQNLSPDEVQRMNHERETLTRNVEEIRLKLGEASRHAYDQEMHVTKAMDDLEQLVQDYTALGTQIGTIPPPDAGRQYGPGNVDYTIELDIGISDVGVIEAARSNMADVIRPALAAYGDGFRKQVSELSNSTIAIDNELDKLASLVESRKEEVINHEIKVRVLIEQAEDVKKVGGARTR
jgi:kinetochore protein NDC80